MDESLLPPALPERRPAPLGAILLVFTPAAALAAGVGLQRFFEGPIPSGDALLRWLFWSIGAGAALGVAAGFVRGPRRFWIAWGVISPLLVCGAVVGAVKATLPLREMMADHREADCRSEGRKICTLAEFTAACASRSPVLGDPQFKACDTNGCTSRWTYEGPFRPGSPVGAVMCSVVSDPAGKGVRFALLPADPRN